MNGTLKKMEQEYNKLQQQKLRELARLTFLNLMSANGVMAKTIIRNYKQKQDREVKKNDYIPQAKKIFI